MKRQIVEEMEENCCWSNLRNRRGFETEKNVPDWKVGREMH